MIASAKMPAARHRLAIVTDDSEELERACGGLIRDALVNGKVVLCAAPGLPDGDAQEGGLAGASLAEIPLDPAKPSAYRGGTLKRALKTLVANWRPDVVLVHGPDLLAVTKAAVGRSADICLACLLTARHAGDLPSGSWFSRWQLPRKLRACDMAIVADHDQAAALRTSATGHRPHRIVVTPGSIDIASVTPCELPPLDDGMTFVALDDGGDPAFVDAFRSAASRIAEVSDRARFVVAQAVRYGAAEITDGGHPVEERTFSPGAEMEVIKTAHVVLQGRGRASYPPSLLCAMAAGRPLIARDMPATREAIDELVNGILLPSVDGAAIADAAEGLLRRPDLLASMARASRAKAERRFDAAVVNRAIRAELELG